jgi:hypothetical protein
MTFIDLDDLIAEVDRTCPSTDAIVRLQAAVDLSAQLRELAEGLVTEFVDHARLGSRPWAEIGVVLGVSRQAAQQRFVAPHIGYSAKEFTDELRTAMPLIKQAAISRRHNYIGTEHLLLGVTAEPNAATGLIEELGGSINEMRTALEHRMGLGASQAAERIAWTPFARKSMALAKEAATDEHAHIGCDHLVIGMTQLGRGAAAQALAGQGVTIDTLAQRPGQAGTPAPS